MKPLIEYINESLKPISTNALTNWRMKVAKPDYYHEELTGNHYIRPLIKALVGTGMTKVDRRRRVSDFIEMYFGNYISAKDGSFTLAKEMENMKSLTLGDETIGRVWMSKKITTQI